KYLQGATQPTSSGSWKFSRWPGEKEDQETFGNLIFALERHTLPENLDRLATKDELVNYAFQIGLSWNPNWAANAAPWPHKTAAYPGIATCLTSGSSGLSSSGQSYATVNSAFQPNPVQRNGTAMQAGKSQETPFQPFDTAPDPRRSTQPERPRPIAGRLLR